MKNGKCPKCDSTNIFKQDRGAWMGENGGLYVQTGFATKASDFESYICVDCGYFENYIMDKGKLQEVQKKWTKVP